MLHKLTEAGPVGAAEQRRASPGGARPGGPWARSLLGEGRPAGRTQCTAPERTPPLSQLRRLQRRAAPGGGGASGQHTPSRRERALGTEFLTGPTACALKAHAPAPHPRGGPGLHTCFRLQEGSRGKAGPDGGCRGRGGCVRKERECSFRSEDYPSFGKKSNARISPTAVLVTMTC